MKYIFISDIHGKPRPLRRAFDMMEQLAFDKVVCLGDIVGYGDEPNECIRLIRRNADIVLAGNHEFAVCQKRSWLTSNQRAIEGFLRTQILLSQSELNYLNELPLTHEVDDMLFVHSTPLEPQNFRYPVLTPGGRPASEPFQAVQDIFRAIDNRLVFVGHSHRPGVFLEEEPGEFVSVADDNGVVDLMGRRALVDVGSVGIPRGNSPATFVEYDTDLDEVTYHVIPLDEEDYH